MMNTLRLLAATSLLTAFAVGCGDGRPTRVPVSGKVLIDGAPLTRGALRFKPSDGRVATGAIGADGKFELMTYEPGDGVVTGMHTVTVHASEELSNGSVRWFVPKKYHHAATSGLSQSIEEPTDDLVIELTWDGKPGPFVE